MLCLRLSVFNEELRDYTRPFGFDEFSCTAEDLLSLPLVNHPGTRFEYGVSVPYHAAYIPMTAFLLVLSN